ncbi:3-oxo-5-alpha-steroid 4-dehydrogenase-domain-containing protein [Lentinula aciculospora]|uniref:very-long-chain enoyl-CoA reductase n=1 Tax=Lentinula aciculospora TaxID=153920 RepID=A0A9W9A7B6_9AGAR|nr:3-oxo-5-alpha-steroid 4-dehydrogenase-domain-containing protein [Lentinula aciculospora]
MALFITVSAASNRVPSFARNAFPLTLEASPEETVQDVKTKIQAKIPKLYTSRQRLTLKSENKPLVDDVRLKDAGFATGVELEVKDLGPQVGWKTVFVVEYAGPLLIHPVFYDLPRLFYGTDIVHSDLQRMVFAMIEVHFAKRILETLFVHRFSHGTMPLFNIFKNSAHYHVLSGFFLAYDLYRPVFSASSLYVKGTFRNNPQFLWVCAGLWAFFELSNLSAHLHLRSLRPAGTRTRAIPTGYGFGLVSCPNYFFETLAWGVVCAMTGSWASYLFTIVGTAQMIAWALKKHAAYKKEFGKTYPKRKAMIPFII